MGRQKMKISPERLAEMRVAYEAASRTYGYSSYSEHHAARAACIPMLGEALLELERRQPARVASGGPQVVLTPKPFFDFLSAQYGGFARDLAASPENALCPRYFTEQDNALTQSWLVPGWSPTCQPWQFNNPPFGTISPWTRTAHSECLLGARIVQLLKMAIGSEWFQAHVKGGPCKVKRMWGRLPFMGYQGRGANFDTMVIEWHGGRYSEEDWDWRADLQAWFDKVDYPTALLLEWGWKRWEKGRRS